MKKSNAIQSGIFAMLLLPLCINAQWGMTWPGPNPGSWGPSGKSDPALTNPTPWALGGNHLNPINVPNALHRTASIGTINDDPFVLKANQRESIFLLQSSFVGIGWNNTTPTAPLDIWTTYHNTSNRSRLRIFADYMGNIESSEYMSLHFADDRDFFINQGGVGGANTVQRFQIKDGGFVGINSTSPGAALDIKSPIGNPQGNIRIYGDPNGNIESAGPINLFHFTGTDFSLSEGNMAGSTSRLKVKTGGFVGINSSNPQAALEVKNAAGQGSMRIMGDVDGTIEGSGGMSLVYNAGNRFYITEKTGLSFPNPYAYDRITIWNGNVGIDEISPSERLTVNGNTRIYGNLGLGIQVAQEKCHIVGNLRVDGLSKLNGSVETGGPVGINCAPANGWTTKIWDPTSATLFVKGGGSATSKITLGNSWGDIDFSMDQNAVGHIEQFGISMINWKPGGWPYYPQVWIGKRPTTGNHTDFQFAVDGKLVAKSIYVTLTGSWADYVFADDYKLPKLEDVESYYKTNKHLPEIPSAKEVEDNGIDVAEMNKLLLKKVEELTIYVVEQQKQLSEQKQLISELKESLDHE